MPSEPAPIRIALVITELHVGGAERCLTELALGLHAGGFEPTVYSLGPRPEGPRAALVRQLEAAGVPLRFADARSARDAWRVYRRLSRWLAEQAPDVVQTFLFHANMLGALAAGRVTSAPVVTGVRVRDPSRWRAMAEGWGTRRAAHVVCVSRAVKAHVVREIGFSKDRVSVIPNGIDLDRYPAAPADLSRFGIAPGRRVVLYVGRLHRQKGLDWLLAAAPPLFEQLPDHDLLLVGAGDPDAYRQQAEQYGIASRVFFGGWQDDIPGILASSEMLVLPSLWEGMPNVVLEAMASRRPVVVTRVEGVAELLGSDERQMIDVGDREALVARIRQLADNRLLRKQVGESNRLRAGRFRLDAMVARYARLYTELLAASSKAEAPP